jgi:Tropinone reductase 1
MAGRWNLEGKLAVVTGGTKGIGRAVAEEFLELGASVFVIARDETLVQSSVLEWSARFPGRFGRIIVSLRHIEPPRIFGFSGDVSEPSLRASFVEAVKVWSSSVVVNDSSGHSWIISPSLDTS